MKIQDRLLWLAQLSGVLSPSRIQQIQSAELADRIASRSSVDPPEGLGQETRGGLWPTRTALPQRAPHDLRARDKPEQLIPLRPTLRARGQTVESRRE